MKYAAIILLVATLWQAGQAPAGQTSTAPQSQSQPHSHSRPASGPAGQITIANFDAGLPAGVVVTGAKLELLNDSNTSAAGAGCAKLTLDIRLAPQARLALALPAEARLDPAGELSARIRVDKSYGELDMRWLALDGDGRAIHQRRFGVQVKQTEHWKEFRWPMYEWRWADDRVGEWSDVRSLVLVVENWPGQVYLDEVNYRPVKADSAKASAWLQQIAFGASESGVRTCAEGDVLVATNAMDTLSMQDLRIQLRRMKQIDAWFARVFGPAYRPVKGAAPATMLIFKDATGYAAFYRRLGEAWNEKIVPPSSAGYTVQDIAASTYNAEFGIHRPVYVHEAVHAMAARDFRLLNGLPRTDWLHEGLANYVQIAMYPASVDPHTYATNFATPMNPQGKGVFVPLKMLFAGPVGMGNYAQAASVVAFLLEKHPDWLGIITRDLADGQDIAVAMKPCGATVADLEREWFEWGGKTYPANDKRTLGDAVFPLPAELIAPAPTSSPARE